MAQLFAPPKFVETYAFCVDDSLPNFVPDKWIKKNRLYKMKFFTDSLNTSEMAITITDNKGEEINPSDNIKSFKSERFIFFNLIMN